MIYEFPDYVVVCNSEIAFAMVVSYCRNGVLRNFVACNCIIIDCPLVGCDLSKGNDFFGVKVENCHFNSCKFIVEKSEKFNVDAYLDSINAANKKQ